MLDRVKCQLEHVLILTITCSAKMALNTMVGNLLFICFGMADKDRESFADSERTKRCKIRYKYCF